MQWCGVQCGLSCVTDDWCLMSERLLEREILDLRNIPLLPAMRPFLFTGGEEDQVADGKKGKGTFRVCGRRPGRTFFCEPFLDPWDGHRY